MAETSGLWAWRLRRRLLSLWWSHAKACMKTLPVTVVTTLKSPVFIFFFCQSTNFVQFLPSWIRWWLYWATQKGDANLMLTKIWISDCFSEILWWKWNLGLFINWMIWGFRPNFFSFYHLFFFLFAKLLNSFVWKSGSLGVYGFLVQCQICG